MVGNVFNKGNISLQKVLDNSEQALFATEDFIDSTKEVKCQLRMVLHMPIRMWGRSFALQKESPYKEIMNHLLMELQENGVVPLLRKRFENFKYDCQDNPRSRLSFKKVVMPFTLLAAGVFFAIVICKVEILITFWNRHFIKA